MKHIIKRSTPSRWLMPLLGSISLIDITLGSLFAGAAMARGPEALHLTRISLGLLLMGCLSLWGLSMKRLLKSPLTDHSKLG